MAETTRLCLRCGKPFKSKGPANRLCFTCNRENAKVRDRDVYPAPKEKP